jgi:hypothetical protein
MLSIFVDSGKCKCDEEYMAHCAGSSLSSFYLEIFSHLFGRKLILFMTVPETLWHDWNCSYRKTGVREHI